MGGYLTVPENVVQQAADDVKDDPNNSFFKVLRAGQEFKNAGLTPIYILDPNFMDVVVVAKELMGKKLN